SPQLLLEKLRLMIAAIKDRVIGKFATVLEPVRKQTAHHTFGLGLVVGGRRDPNRVAVAVLTPQPLLVEFWIVRNQRVRRAQDPRRRAVVLLELDHFQRGIVARQPGEIVERSATPSVDRLVVVTDGGEQRPLAGEEPQKLVLRGIRVLVLVDQQITAPLSPLR